MQEEKGDTLAAYKAIKEGRSKYPNDKDLIIDEYNYFLKQGKQDEAIKNLELAINADPNNKFLYGALGSLFLENYDYEKVTNKDIYNSLNLISEYMKKNIFIPNNINFPHSRMNFIKNVISEMIIFDRT